MVEGPVGIKIFPDHFQASSSGAETPQARNLSISEEEIKSEVLMTEIK